jgi:AAA family ATP:ADP antiporter
MVLRLRRFLDVRPGEGLRVLLAFLYIAAVVAAFLLAKPIRNSLFLKQYGPYALVYVYAAVPIALTLFVPIYTRIAVRVGARAVTVWTLVFFSGNVLLFWYAFRAQEAAGVKTGTVGWLLPAVFYVWVNCFGVIAPVQAWSFANSLFDTRQAKRLFGLIGAGASLGAITGGILARFLVGPVGGTVNMLLVLAALILFAAAIVSLARARIRRTGPSRRGHPSGHPFRDSMRQIAASPYLRLMAAVVFLIAISTQWSAFQLSLVADRHFGGNGDALTKFFGSFNFALGAVSFLLQLFLAGPLLRRFGIGVAMLLLPLSLGFGSALILLAPAFWSVLLTNASDQALRFSLDKATYELLYLPLAPAERGPLKGAIDIVVSRIADAVGAVMLGVATHGFFMLEGLGLGLRGTAAVNLGFIGAWGVVAWRLRAEYVLTIEQSIHRHRLERERTAANALPSTAAVIGTMLAAPEADSVRRALAVLERQPIRELQERVRELLTHPAPDIRRRALSVLDEWRDAGIDPRATEMLRDPDLGVRTQALLYLTRSKGVDPLRQLEQLGDVEEFSIRAGMAAFLVSPGPSQNLDAARLVLEAMAHAAGPAGLRDRTEAAHVLALLPNAFEELLVQLIRDEDAGVARQAILAARSDTGPPVLRALIAALARPAVNGDAARALAQFGDRAVPELERRLHDAGTSLDIRRELPAVLVLIGTPLAQQVLMEGLLQADVTLRHRVLTSLNKLHELHPAVFVDQQVIQLLLAAEIAGHYRSYQVLGPLRAQLKPDDAIVEALREAMEQELERIFRLMALLHVPAGHGALHDAYFGIRSSTSLVRANALEFLENVLTPDLRRILLPLLDSQVTIDERIALADRIVGAPVKSAEHAVETLLASGDSWLRSCAVFAVGALHLHGLEGELRELAETDPGAREAIDLALQQLAGAPDPAQTAPVPSHITSGVG